MDLDLKRLSFLYNALKEKTPKEMASDPLLRELSAELREIYIQYINGAIYGPKSFAGDPGRRNIIRPASAERKKGAGNRSGSGYSIGRFSFASASVRKVAVFY